MTYRHNYSIVWELMTGELHNEIKKSSISEVFHWVTSHITDTGYDIECIFDAQLSTEDEVILAWLVSSHWAIEDTSEHYVIYDKVVDSHLKKNKKEAPVDLHYWAFGFDKEKVFEKGLLKTVKYWTGKNIQTWEFEWLAVKEENTYNRDSNDNIIDRDKDIVRYKKDGTTSVVKSTKKTFTKKEGIAVDDIARSNILSDVKYDCVWLVSLTEWLDEAAAKIVWLPFVSDMALEMQQFRDWNRQPLIDAINANLDYSWLDNDTWIPDGQWGTLTIRQFVVYSVSP